MRSGWRRYRQKQKRKRGQAEKEKRADEIPIQMAQIEAAKDQVRIQTEKELALKDLELKPEIKPVPVLQLIHLLVIEMLSPRSYQPS